MQTAWEGRRFPCWESKINSGRAAFLFLLRPAEARAKHQAVKLGRFFCDFFRAHGEWAKLRQERSICRRLTVPSC